MTFTTVSLSASSSDKPIEIDQTSAGSAVLIHTAVNNGSDYDIVELFANNHTGTDEEIVVLIGGTTAAEEIRKTIPAKDTKLVLAGYKVGSGQTVKAFLASTASAVNVFGKVGRNT